MSLVKAIKWNVSGQLMLFALRLFSTIILARIYGPAVFGDYAIVYVIVSLSQVFVDSGFKSALIQKSEVSTADYSTVFFFNLTVSFTLAGILFFISPVIASLYAVVHLQHYLQLASLIFVVRSFGFIQAARFSRKMDFKPLMLGQITGMAGMIVVSVMLGMMHYGVYGLIWGSLTHAVLETLFVWMSSSERVNICFSRASFKRLGVFGFSALGASLLSELSSRLDIFILGRYISSSSLGLYNKARDYAQMPAGFLSKVINASYFPLFSQLQNDKVKFTRLYYESLAIVVVIALMTFGFLFISAGFLVPLVLGSNWISAIPYFKLFLIYSLLYIISTFSLYALNALGKSRLYLNIALFLYTLKISMLVACVLLGIKSPYAFIWLSIGIMALDTGLTYYYLRKNLLSAGIVPVRAFERKVMHALVRGALPFTGFTLLIYLDIPLLFAAVVFAIFFGMLIFFLLTTIKRINTVIHEG